MPFPTNPVPIVVEIAPGVDPASDPSTWMWTDVTQYTTARDGGVRTTAGKADEFGTAGPATCSVTVNNTSGRFVPRNPTGPYYPNLRRNTPLRVRIQAATDTWTRSASSSWGTSNSGQVWTTSGGTAADYNVTGTAGTLRLSGTVTPRSASLIGMSLLDFDYKVSVTLSATPTGGNMISEIRAREVDANNFIDARLFYFTSGAVQINLRQMVAGVETFTTFPVVPAVTATTPLTLRFRANGSTLRVKVWATANSEPTTWNHTLTTTMLAPGTIALRGIREVANTNTNPLLTFDNLTVCVDRFTGFIDSFPATWDDLVPFVQLSASGVSRRLGQSDTDLVSAMRRAIAAANPVAYWPVEGSGGLRYPEIQGRAPIFASGLSGGGDAPGGSASLPSFSSDAAARGTVARYSPAPRWSVEFLLKPSEPAAESTYLTWYTTATVAPYWSFGITPAGGTDNFFLKVVTSTATIATSTLPFNLGTPYTEWLYVRAVAEEDGGGGLDVDWRVWAFATERDLIFSASNTFSITSPAGLVNQVFVGPVADGATIGHVSVWRTDTRDLTTDNARYVNGFAGETAGARMLRIATENGIPLRVDGDPADTTVMGAQPVASFLTAVRECEATDGGILYDGLDGRLTYLTRAVRNNALVLLPLDNADGHLTPDFAPVDDDQGLRNAVTASRAGGSSATYEDAISIAAEGRYEASVQVNVQDDTTLLDQAAWRVHLGTVDDMRYPTVSLNLLGDTDLIPPWLSCSPGARLTIANQPAELPPGLIDQHALGWSEQMDGAEWSATLNCVPARPFNIAVLEGTGSTQARVGSDASTLNSGITTTGTSLSVAVSDGNLWTTSAGDRPFDIGVGGEQMRVTNVTGASSPQTFTVTRSVNGVVKTHSSGEQVRLWQPAVVGL